jgi:hypothetical protein
MNRHRQPRRHVAKVPNPEVNAFIPAASDSKVETSISAASAYGSGEIMRVQNDSGHDLWIDAAVIFRVLREANQCVSSLFPPPGAAAYNTCGA